MTTELIKKVPFLSKLSENELLTLADHAAYNVYPKRTVVIREGTESDALYIVASGKVKIFLSDEDGKEVTLSVETAGGYFGEIALLDDAPRSASAITLQQSRLLIISKSDFKSCLSQNPDIAFSVTKALTEKIRQLTERVGNFASQNVYGRLTYTLMNLSEQVDGRHVIPRKITQQEIADRIGSSREMVGRLLGALSLRGDIVYENKIISFDKPLPKDLAIY